MAILQAQLKKQLNTLLPSAANSINMNRPTTTQPPDAPSPMVTSSEEFMAKELAVLQANLKKAFLQDMAAFQYTKHSSSTAKFNEHHPRISNCNVKLPPTPIAPSKQRAGCTTGKMTS